MAKAPSESRIPTFGSRIPIPGKFRFHPTITTLKNPKTELQQISQSSEVDNKNDTIDLTETRPGSVKTPVSLEMSTSEINRLPTNSESNQIICNEMDVVQITEDNFVDGICSVTLDAGSAEATFVQKSTQLQDEKVLIVSELTVDDIGRRVCVANVQTGVLKYLGKVNFNAGLWCGVELDNPVGKHDGFVKGVRYFACRADCGIMAPVSKVTLIPDNNTYVCDNIFNVISAESSDTSGPYSLMEIDTNNALPTNGIGAKTTVQNEEPLVVQDLTFTFKSECATRVATSHETHIKKSPENNSNEHNIRYIAGQSTDFKGKIRKSMDSTFSISPLSLDGSMIKHMGLHKNTSTPVQSPIETSNIPKQNSFELDESLGILTPDQMLDFSAVVETIKTPSSEDLKSVLSSKRMNMIIEQKNEKRTDPFGISTPDQMLDFSAVVETIKTPSSEDLKSVVSSKRSDKTISNSRTPSSENLGSLPIDGFKASMNMIIEQKNEKITRPDTIDLRNTVDYSSKANKFTANFQAEISSPPGIENSIIDFSLGLIDEDMLASGNQFSSNLDTTTNLDLPLDSVGADERIEKFKSLSRSEQTPSPEDLPLDPIDPIKLNDMDHLEPTTLSIPSNESDSKNEGSKSTATTKTNSFITSVTSITSLDTGYQGDGEMSRPASRGADNSPVAHKPNNPALANLQWQRAVARRPDPMTDSDFFTESDVDGHEENAPRGDRHAQVIDGTLYGVNAQAAAAPQDIFLGNQEEMDSSGVFTDLDMNNRVDDFSDSERNRMEVVTEDKSPSDTSTNTISDNSQEIKEAQDMDSTLVNENQNNEEPIAEVIINISSEKTTSPTQSIISNAGSRKSTRMRTPSSKDENPAKKFKMPNRNVTSKVKIMMESAKINELDNQDNRKSIRKATGRWDAVMNKISKGQEENKSKLRLKEVKSKVSTGIMDTSLTNKRCENRKTTLDDSSATKSKIRRVRTRADPISGNKLNNRIASSAHSSFSDLSVGVSPPKKTSTHSPLNRVNKKREVGVGRCSTPVTEVLIPGGHKPAPVTSLRAPSTQRVTRDLKKSPLLSASSVPDGKEQVPARRTLSRRNVGSTTTHKSSAAKDQSRVTGVSPHKGDSPVRNQILPEKTQAANLLPHVKHSAKGVEALGVLVQYLVFNLDAFRTPGLKRELDNLKSQWIKDKLELEETRMGYRRLEDNLSEQKSLAAQTLENERVKYRAEIAELFEKQRQDFIELKENHKQEKYELERRLQEENAELKYQLDAEITNRENEIAARIEVYTTEHKYKVQELEQANGNLRQEHQITIEILREENESIREQLDDKSSISDDLNELRYRNERLKNEFNEKEICFDLKLMNAREEISLLKEENKKILETFKSDTKDNKLQISQTDRYSFVPQAALGRCTQLQDEVESLRTVLDLKLAELSELRRAHGELVQAAEELPQALVRAQSLQARVEDLEMQLERKTEMELHLTKENKRLMESYSQESKQKKRLSLYNEELQWKLKQNSEVVNAILQGSTPNRKSLHGSNQSLCDDMSCKTPCGGYLSRSLHTSSFNEKHLGTNTSQHILERTLSFREKTKSFVSQCSRISDTSNDRSNNKSDYFELDDSPPSSPIVKGVVEKSDSVSWVLDMDESPEILASRMVRRAGSFRNITPPKFTPTKSPAPKRPRTKSNNLSLSASAGAIVSSENKNDNRFRSKSVSLRDSQSPESNCHSDEYLSKSWHYSLRTSTPKSGLEPIRSGTKLENNPDLEHDSDAAISLPVLPSEINRTHNKIKDMPDSLPSLPSGDLLLLQSAFPKNSAGEAMISESNSEDECSSSTSERSPSVSDTETSAEDPTESGDKCIEKHSKMQYDLFLMTESTNSEAMDCSWSEELDM